MLFFSEDLIPSKLLFLSNNYASISNAGLYLIRWEVQAVRKGLYFSIKQLIGVAYDSKGG